MTEATGLGRRLRLGMVGGGRDAFIGAVHRIAARLDDRFDFCAGALSSDPEKARASGADLLLADDRCYGSYAEMAAAEATRPDGIDAVAIVTPNHVHAEAATAFLDQGIHVICDKPLTTNLATAEAVQAAVVRSGLIFGLTHNYTGYPMVRQARDMVAGGDLGRIRVIQVEYPQDWLSANLEATGQKQAEWRTDPARSGPAGCVGDIGTHAYHLARFITDLLPEALAADLSRFVDGRRLDDNAHIMLRFAGGARGMIWASQVAPGNENALKIRIYGDAGGLEWAQESPNALRYSPLGEQPRILTRGGPGLGAAAERATRIPPGHPEGYLEGFAQLYADFADQLEARILERSPDPAAMLLPGVGDGVDGVRFITRTVESAESGGGWVTF